MIIAISGLSVTVIGQFCFIVFFLSRIAPERAIAKAEMTFLGQSMLRLEASVSAVGKELHDYLADYHAKEVDAAQQHQEFRTRLDNLERRRA